MQFRQAFGLGVQLNEPPLQARVLLSRAYLALQLRNWKQASDFAQLAKSIYRRAGDDRGSLQASLLLTYVHSVELKFGQALSEAGYLLSMVWQIRKAGIKTLLHLMRGSGNW